MDIHSGDNSGWREMVTTNDSNVSVMYQNH